MHTHVIHPQHMHRGLYSSQNVCLSAVCHSQDLGDDTSNKHQCQANYVLFILKRTDFCVNLFIPSEKAAVRATLTDSTVLMFAM